MGTGRAQIELTRFSPLLLRREVVSFAVPRFGDASV